MTTSVATNAINTSDAVLLKLFSMAPANDDFKGDEEQGTCINKEYRSVLLVSPIPCVFG